MNDLVEMLKEIEDENGFIDPKEVVERARPSKSPIHHFFEWNDGVAGEMHRVWQARTLIKTVKVEISGKKTNAYFNVILQKEPKKQGYVSVQTALTDKDLHQQMLEDAVKDLRNYQSRYSTLKEIDNLIDEDELSSLEQMVLGQ